MKQVLFDMTDEQFDKMNIICKAANIGYDDFLFKMIMDNSTSDESIRLFADCKGAVLETNSN